MSERRDLAEIDLSGVSSPDELHAVVAKALDFPEFYGRNWDAFWDAITGLVAMPRRLRVSGWASLASRLPEEAEQMRSCLEEMARQYPRWAAEVEYA